MKIVIFFNANVNFKCDLSSLKEADTQYVLLVTPSILPQISENNRFFFHFIHVVEPMEDAQVWPLVDNYAKKVTADNLVLVTHDEHCLPIIARLKDHFEHTNIHEKAIKRFVNKLSMKDVLDQAGIRTPRHMAFDPQRYDQTGFIQELEQLIGYPCIVKPVSLYGAASVKKITSREQWLEWGKRLTQSRIAYEIEEYVTGKLYHCDALVQDSRIIFSSVSEYFWPLAFFEQGYCLGSIWLPPDHKLWTPLNDFNRAILTALDTPDGATHGEIFINEAGELIFLEVAARPPGALIVPMIEKITGINVELDHLRLQLNLPVNIQEQAIKEYYLYSFIPKKAGKIKALLTPPLTSETHIEWYVQTGQEIKPTIYKESDIIFQKSAQAAALLLHQENFAKLYEDFLRIKNFDFIEVE